MQLCPRRGVRDVGEPLQGFVVIFVKARQAGSAREDLIRIAVIAVGSLGH